MLKIEELTVKYKKQTEEYPILDSINLDLPEKGFIAICGKSGSGKSTLIRTIAGMIKPITGTISIDEEFVLTKEKWRMTNLKEKLVFLPQDPLFIEGETVFNLFKIIYENIADKKENLELLIVEKLNLLNLPKEYLYRVVEHLSMGERRRIAFALATICDSKIYIVDEPTENLDKENAKILLEHLYELSKTKLVIMVSHNMNQVKVYANRIITIDKSKIISDMENHVTVNNLIEEPNGERAVDHFIVLKKENKKNRSPFASKLFMLMFSIFFVIFILMNIRVIQIKDVMNDLSPDFLYEVKGLENKIDGDLGIYPRLDAHYINSPYLTNKYIPHINLTTTFNDYLPYYFTDSSFINSKNITKGRMPSNENEAIISTGLVKKLLKNNNFNQYIKNEKDILDYLISETLDYEICGIFKEDSSLIAFSFKSHLDKRISLAKNVNPSSIIEGNMPQKANEILMSKSYMNQYKIGDEYNGYIDPYVITGFVETNCETYVSEIYYHEDHLINNTRNLSQFYLTKDAVSKLRHDGYKVISLKSMTISNARNQKFSDNIVLFIFLLLGILLMLYLISQYFLEIIDQKASSIAFYKLHGIKRSSWFKRYYHLFVNQLIVGLVSIIVFFIVLFVFSLILSNIIDTLALTFVSFIVLILLYLILVGFILVLAYYINEKKSLNDYLLKK